MAFFTSARGRLIALLLLGLTLTLGAASVRFAVPAHARLSFVERCRSSQMLQIALRFDAPSRETEQNVPRWLLRSVGPEAFQDPVEISVLDATGRYRSSATDAQSIQKRDECFDILNYAAEHPTVEELYLYGLPQRMSDLGALKDAPGLRTLSLASPALDGSVTSYIERWSKLESFRASVRSLNDDSLRPFARAARFTSIDLYADEFGERRLTLADVVAALDGAALPLEVPTDAGFESFRALPRLKRLRIVPSFISDRGLDAVGSLATLESLGLGGGRLTQRGAESIARCARLKELELQAFVVEAGVGAALAELAELETVRIFDCDLRAVDLAALAKSRRLQELMLDAVEVAPEQLDDLARAAPDLRIVRDTQPWRKPE
ncbi:MAG TPA: hypothetical protein VGE52_18825 [Pirellulales bacterium]